VHRLPIGFIARVSLLKFQIGISKGIEKDLLLDVGDGKVHWSWFGGMKIRKVPCLRQGVSKELKEKRVIL
jgi:hypothetical protein